MARKSYFQEFYQFKDVFYFLVWRNIKVRYKQTLLGVSWAVLNPVFTMLVFTVVFGRLVKVPSDNIPYPLFTYIALVPWTFFSASISMSGNSLVANANLIRKVYFPRVALPVAAVVSGLVDLFLASLVLVGMLVYYQIGISWEMLFLPLLLLPLLILALGMGMLLAALNARYRDVKHVIPFMMQMWLFATPVIYPTSILPERWANLAALNPMTGIIEAFRAGFLPDHEIAWFSLGVSVLISVVVFTIGNIYFRLAEAELADVI